MKAVVHPRGKIKYEPVEDRVVKDKRDAISKVTATAICDSKLHIYNTPESFLKLCITGKAG
jgi:threonine dehydrogenase-like Zn-dependent dehydrogenase